MMAQTERDLGWASGLFEGEGSVFSATKRWKTSEYQTSSASLVMCDLDSVERFAQAVGFGRVTGPYTPKTPRSKPYYRWTTNGFERTQALAALLWSGLGQRRREQVRATLRADTTRGRPQAEKGQPARYTYVDLRGHRRQLERAG